MEQVPRATPAYWRLYAAQAMERAESMRTPLARDAMVRIAITAGAMADSLERISRSRTDILESSERNDAAGAAKPEYDGTVE